MKYRNKVLEGRDDIKVKVNIPSNKYRDINNIENGTRYKDATPGSIKTM